MQLQNCGSRSKSLFLTSTESLPRHERASHPRVSSLDDRGVFPSASTLFFPALTTPEDVPFISPPREHAHPSSRRDKTLIHAAVAFIFPQLHCATRRRRVVVPARARASTKYAPVDALTRAAASRIFVDGTRNSALAGRGIRLAPR